MPAWLAALTVTNHLFVKDREGREIGIGKAFGIATLVVVLAMMVTLGTSLLAT